MQWEIIKRKERFQKVSSLLYQIKKTGTEIWKSGKFDPSTDWRTGIRLQLSRLLGCQTKLMVAR